MTDPKDGGSFFRKVVKFVANPGTEWKDLSIPSATVREAEFAKHELKAMIERKRRNDFVRKREFDMLRKLRRDGLTGEQLAALGLSSRLDDSDARPAEQRARADVGVKAKIDAIEQQMTGNTSGGYPPTPRPTESFYAAPTEPAAFAPAPGTMPGTRPAPLAERVKSAGAGAGAAGTGAGTAGLGTAATEPSQRRDAQIPPSEPSAPRAAGTMAPGLSPLAGGRPARTSGDVEGTPLPDVDLSVPSSNDGTAAGTQAESRTGTGTGTGRQPVQPAAPAASTDLQRRPAGSSNPFAVEIVEIAHDPDLDEAVIAFANAEFESCETTLAALIAPGAPRSDDAPTWLALFDLYRAIGQQPKFDTLASLYAQRFGSSAPQWFSLPKLVAEAAVDERRQRPGADAQVSWLCPQVLDADHVAVLYSRSLQMPLPWVFDWSALRSVEPEACSRLSELFRNWIPQRIDMRWIDGDRLVKVLSDAAPTGVRDTDPALWQLRFDTLRMANRPDQFDEAAIDYCVTYEVSPPSWEPSECRVRLSSAQGVSTLGPMSIQQSELSSGFVESQIIDDQATTVAHVELSGQLIGDISTLLGQLQAQLGAATAVHVSCTRLIRVDFIAAGDLLNWVLARRGEHRTVGFIETHRLVGLFFGAMGINEHAQVRVRVV